MNTNKYLDTKNISARRKARFIREAREASDKAEVFALAKDLALESARKAPLSSSVKELTLALYATGLSAYTLERSTTVEEYMVSYIRWKFACYEQLNDTGALGDVIETAIHLIAMRKKWRSQKRNLHVAKIGDTDVRIGGVRFEVGHNAKMWTDATVEDAMSGPFDGVIYGMIDNEELRAIGKLMKHDTARALTEIANMMYVFPDKNEFCEVMQNDLGRSPTLKYREDLNVIITVYNPSKQKAWISRMEGAEYQTLTEYMLSLGDNDWLK